MISNMYSASKLQWNPFVGCLHDCVYCKSSFQRSLKRWGKNHCQDCYTFKPHNHQERLVKRLPKTDEFLNEFIFVCASSDIAFCDPGFLQKIIDRIKAEPDKTFLLQSKNPEVFFRMDLTPNMLLGITLESNRHYPDVSKAPTPAQRVEVFSKVRHHQKMVTIEPVLKFDLSEMLSMLDRIKPCLVWLGMDSKNCKTIRALYPTKKEFYALYEGIIGYAATDWPSDWRVSNDRRCGVILKTKPEDLEKKAK